MQYLSMKEMLKAERDRVKDTSKFKSCNLSTIDLMACVGTHWGIDRKLVAVSKKYKYTSEIVDGILRVKSETL